MRIRDRVWKHVAATAIVMSGVMVLAQCATSTDGSPSGASQSPVNAPVTAVVDDEGFSVVGHGAKVTGPAGVAPSGTSVAVDRASGQLPGEWSRFATPLADGISVRLGGDEQPRAPITLVFDGLTAATNVFVLSESAGVVELLPQTMAGPLVAETTHLSSFWPVLVKVSDLADMVFTSATDALQMTAPKPDCFVEDGDHSDMGLRLTAVPGDAVWPCLEKNSGAVQLTLESNSSVAWRVKTDPEWQRPTPTAYELANILALGVWRASAPNAADEAMLLPGETATFVNNAPPTTTVGMIVDPVMSQIRTLALGLGFLLPARAIDKISQSECLPDLIRSGSIADEPSATGFAAIIRCFGAVIGGAGGALLGLVAAAPAALWVELEGVLRSALARDQLTFSVQSQSAGGVYISSFEANSLIGTVDVATGTFTEIGRAGAQLTDIAFVGEKLYGIGFSSLYEIDKVAGTARKLSDLGATGANALVGQGSTLYAATTDGQLLTVDPARGVLGRTELDGGFTSSGDLAFLGDGSLVMSAEGSGGDQLVRVDAATGATAKIGSIGRTDVYGLGWVNGQLIGATHSGEMVVIDQSTGASGPSRGDLFISPSGIAVER